MDSPPPVARRALALLGAALIGGVALIVWLFAGTGAGTTTEALPPLAPAPSATPTRRPPPGMVLTPSPPPAIAPTGLVPEAVVPPGFRHLRCLSPVASPEVRWFSHIHVDGNVVDVLLAEGADQEGLARDFLPDLELAWSAEGCVVQPLGDRRPEEVELVVTVAGKPCLEGADDGPAGTSRQRVRLDPGGGPQQVWCLNPEGSGHAVLTKTSTAIDLDPAAPGQVERELIAEQAAFIVAEHERNEARTGPLLKGLQAMGTGQARAWADQLLAERLDAQEQDEQLLHDIQILELSGTF